MNNKQNFLPVSYTIPHQFTALAAGATTQTSPSISIGTFPFIWTALGVYFHTGSSEDISILIRDESASMNFTKDKASLRSMLNKEDDKYYLPMPYRFRAEASLYVEVKNNHASTAATFDLGFIGWLEIPII